LAYFLLSERTTQRLSQVSSRDDITIGDLVEENREHAENRLDHWGSTPGQYWSPDRGVFPHPERYGFEGRRYTAGHDPSAVDSRLWIAAAIRSLVLDAHWYVVR